MSDGKSSSITLPWKQYGYILKESLTYIDKKAKGEIKSLKTQWKNFNKIGLNGIEWNSLYVISARPGVN